MVSEMGCCGSFIHSSKTIIQICAGWDKNWDIDRKMRYLEMHNDEREQYLMQDRALRERYFQLHREEADDFYRRHAEFASEWNGDPYGDCKCWHKQGVS